ncbi:hypothetical protein F4779DRAFT_2450 [Xylariaceae sp. FL0662B]|nr:hypothetical protein F4779DRAFT_2450 [Xylariaceae sp. FL0662B]
MLIQICLKQDLFRKVPKVGKDGIKCPLLTPFKLGCVMSLGGVPTSFGVNDGMLGVRRQVRLCTALEPLRNSGRDLASKLYRAQRNGILIGQATRCDEIFKANRSEEVTLEMDLFARVVRRKQSAFSADTSLPINNSTSLKGKRGDEEGRQKTCCKFARFHLDKDLGKCFQGRPPYKPKVSAQSREWIERSCSQPFHRKDASSSAFGGGSCELETSDKTF